MGNNNKQTTGTRATNAMASCGLLTCGSGSGSGMQPAAPCRIVAPRFPKGKTKRGRCRDLNASDTFSRQGFITVVKSQLYSGAAISAHVGTTFTCIIIGSLASAAGT